MAEFCVAHETDLSLGEMKQVQAGNTPVLLVRLEDRFHAVGALCTHYEAPLAAGALCDDRVICPWHHACFNVRNGEQNEPPGLDPLPVYPVRVDAGEVWVEIPAEHPPPPPRGVCVSERKSCVVIGAGCGGAYAVEALRHHGFDGRIVWISGDEFPPIDRPLLSKGYLSGESSEQWLPLREPAFYDALEISLEKGSKVTSLEAKSKTLTLDDGRVMGYDSAILATGAVARPLVVPGSDLEGIFNLHSLQDCERLRKAVATAHKAVVVGSGFIGMEVAQSLRKRGIAVTVAGPGTVPFENVLGPGIGALIQRIHEQEGVSFQLGQTVTGFEGDGKVRQVRLQDGTLLEADLVVVGIGVQPATGFVNGIARERDGSLLVDETLRVSEGLYAIGDLARFPDWRSGIPIRVEHWRVAAQHGRIAGANVAGRRLAYRGVPYFWTRQFGVTLHYIGHAEGWDEIHIDGELEKRSFIAYYLKDDKVHAVAGMEKERELAELEERIRGHGLFSVPHNSM